MSHMAKSPFKFDFISILGRAEQEKSNVLTCLMSKYKGSPFGNRASRQTALALAQWFEKSLGIQGN